MNETRQMLDDYVKQGSDSAFRELVSRYIDLVYSVALRRVSGDTHRAEDITQKVFADLARKAHSLPRNVMLGGWLHRHCCFVANTSNRTESRRHAREREAIQMEALNSAPDSSWSEVAPELDSAIQELPESDRDAIILRFFESQDLKKVGTVLGVSEDAAQKRVSRALEKLRGILLRHGVTLSIAGLTTGLLTQATTAAPTSLAPQIIRASLQNAAATGGLLAGLAAWLHTIPVKVALVAVAAGLTYLAISHKSANSPATNKEVNSSLQAKTTSGKSIQTGFVKTVGKPAAFADVTPQETFSGLRLQLIDAATSTPITNALVEQRMWLGKKFMPQKYYSDENGFCEVALPEGITELNLTTRVDPYADTRLLWHPDRGDKIPPTYLLRLIPGVPIGGLVVDAENRPVPSAKVGFNHEESPSSETEIENHNFAWIETETDSEGKWRINRIAEEVLRRIYGSASEPEHVSAKMLFVTQEPLALQKLKMFNYTFQLGDAVTISGFVRDESGNAVPDAKVLVGSEGSSDARRAQVNLDGSFEVKGCKPGKNLVTAEAPRYAPTTIQVDLKPNQEPINIRLKAGKVLKLLVVNKQDEPIANAQVWLNTMDSRPIMANEIAAPFIQTEYSPKTDRDGRVFWDQAPDRELAFDIEAAGYMRIFGWKVKPDGQEHKVTLGNALKIQGTVVDAQTQAPIPRFKIITGWPESLANPVPRWSSIDRFWLTFNDGKFEHTFGEPPIVGTPEPAFMFKFEAEGYAPFISRVIKVDEGTVTLDVALTQAKAQVVTVLQPGGTPAAHADVAFGNQSEYIHVAENGFSRLTTPLKVTDAKGQFAWQADPTVEFIIIYHSNGFVVTSPTDLANNSSVQLSGWGRIEGQMTAHGKPKVGRVISYGFDQKSLPKLRVFFEIREKTDASGKFTFEKVPSGKITLSQKIPANPNEPSGAFTEAPLKVVDVKAGETTVFNYDEKGRIVALSLLWPENIHIDEDQQVFAAVTTPFTPPPAEIRNNPNALKIWREQPAVQEMIANMRSWQLIKSSANKWKSAIEIPPGTYQVNVSAVQKNSGPNANILQAMSELVIPDDMNESELEVGPIALQPIPQRLP